MQANFVIWPGRELDGQGLRTGRLGLERVRSWMLAH